MRSKLEITSSDDEQMVAQYKADIKAVEAFLETNVEYVRWLSRRETLGEIHARGFDMSVQIKEAKILEAEVNRLSKHEGAEGSEGFEGSEGPDVSGDESGSGEDQA